MARATNRLTARQVTALKRPGRHSDGAGLYLVVDAGGARRWVFLYRWRGRHREMGLGGAVAVTLADARDAAAAARALIARGIDPLERKAERRAVPTFAAAAKAYIDSIAPSLRNEKHVAQWSSTLATYAAPISARLVSDVTVDDVVGILRPIWYSKAETASRVRGRIERVLDAAKVQGHRAGENPAAWRGQLEHLLPERQRITRGHHKALPWIDVPAFMERLRGRDSISARALEFAILTAARTGEVTGALRSEVAGDLWTVPASRMKSNREHRVPLVPRALEIINEVSAIPGDHLFMGHRRPLSNMAMAELLKGMEPAATVHGFRSAFRDWVEEATSYPGTLAEAALAHIVGDKTERAYRRGDALAKRRSLMEAWERYCMTGGGEVVALASRA